MKTEICSETTAFLLFFNYVWNKCFAFTCFKTVLEKLFLDKAFQFSKVNNIILISHELPIPNSKAFIKL